jgi:hypothetical protein
VKQFQDFAVDVWEKPRWQRGEPKAKTIATAHHWIYCSRGTGERGALKRSWRESKRAFFEHRHAERRRLAITPYPGGGRFWSIPFYIVDCESGGDYDAQNPTSSARGAYQMLSSTYAEHCSACDWSPADQDLAAHRLYVEAGNSPWVCG